MEIINMEENNMILAASSLLIQGNATQKTSSEFWDDIYEYDEGDGM